MVQENIKVVARIRPTSSTNNRNDDQPCLQCDPIRSMVTVENSTYCLDKTFDAVIEQEIIFNDIGPQIIDGFIDGINGTLLAYGQTGSGKTYTMIGNEENYGIIPRAIKRIFEILDAETQDKSQSFKYILKCSFFQIYNENIYDLLQKKMKALKILTTTKLITVKDASEIEVKNFQECMTQIQIGLNQRKTAETSMNQESSRSHAVLQLSLETQSSKDGITKIRNSRLNLVDLAGSERQSQTGNTGIRLQEAGNINNSLTKLAIVIRQIIKNAKYVSYRDSLLTNLLRDSLGGNSKTIMVVNIHSNSEFVRETISTLEFAKSIKNIKNTVKINETFSCEELESCKAENIRLQQENDILKSEVSNLCKEKSSAISKHEEKIENLEAQLSKAKDKIFQFENDDESFVFTEKYEKELASKTNENEKLKKEIDQLKDDGNVQVAKIQELQDKIAQLEQENDRLKCASSNTSEQENDFESGNDERPERRHAKQASAYVEFPVSQYEIDAELERMRNNPTTAKPGRKAKSEDPGDIVKRLQMRKKREFEKFFETFKGFFKED